MSLTVTKEFSFCYGHHLPEYPGLCKNQHGHNSKLLVTVKNPGEQEIRPGMVCDFSILKKVVMREIVEKLDHQNINDLIPTDEFEYIQMIDMPTAENIVIWIAHVLYKHFGTGLVAIRLYETPTSYCEWRR